MPGSTNWIEQPGELVELLPPAFDHVSIPTDACASMNAARTSLFATTLCRLDGAHWFHATAQALGDGLLAADTAGAATTITNTARAATRTIER